MAAPITEMALVFEVAGSANTGASGAKQSQAQALSQPACDALESATATHAAGSPWQGGSAPAHEDPATVLSFAGTPASPADSDVVIGSDCSKLRKPDTWHRAITVNDAADRHAVTRLAARNGEALSFWFQPQDPAWVRL